MGIITCLLGVLAGKGRLAKPVYDPGTVLSSDLMLATSAEGSDSSKSGCEALSPASVWTGN